MKKVQDMTHTEVSQLLHRLGTDGPEEYCVVSESGLSTRPRTYGQSKVIAALWGEGFRVMHVRNTPGYNHAA